MLNNRWVVASALLAVVTLFVVSRNESPLSERTRAELDLRDGVLYVQNSKEPFNGTLIEYFNSTEKKASIEIRDGRAHGVTRGWFENGQQEVEEHFEKGVSNGLRTRWYANGQKKAETQIVDGVISGTFLKWHENGEKALEINLVDGKEEGLSQAWRPSGRLKSRAKMHQGEVVEREFFETEDEGTL